MDHAGLSQPLELWNHLVFSKDNQSFFLNNSWLTAVELKETKDAMVDSHLMPLIMSKQMESQLKVPIHMSQEIKLAKPKVEVSKLVDI